MSQNILYQFYCEKGHTNAGLTFENIIGFSDDEIENTHHFIKWIFPTKHPSQAQPSSPCLTYNDLRLLSWSDIFYENFENAVTWFLRFLKRNKVWVGKYNHNQLRITRAIISIRTLHSFELASWFHQSILSIAGGGDKLSPATLGYWQDALKESTSRSAGALLGLAIGDALGAPVEYKPRGSFEEIKGYISGGQFNLPAGAWTDDTAMALCLGESLLSQQGYSSQDLLTRFWAWAEKGENTSTGIAIGMGQNTLRTLGEFKRSGRLKAEKFGSKNDGNGALMRIAPIPIFYQNDIEKVILIAREQSYATHASDISAECCAYCAFIMALLIQGHTWEQALSRTSEVNWGEEISSLINYEWREKSYQDIKASGYVLASLEASMWCVEHSNSFLEAVLLAVNLGDDADTVGAITGQLAGALYGQHNIDKKLLDGLVSRQDIYSLSQMLCP